MPASASPNIVFIHTDQQRYDSLGCTGCTAARTPHIDELASQGIVYHQHIVANPVCSPARASMFTGRYPTEHGVWINGCRLGHDVRTIPMALADLGYETAHFGKMHLEPIVARTGDGHAYGFQTCEIGEGDQHLQHDDYSKWLRRKEPRLFADYTRQMYEKGHVEAYTSLIPEELTLSDWVTRRSGEWLDERESERPFFLSLGFFDPHHAFNPVEPYASAFKEAEVPEPCWQEDEHEGRPSYYRTFHNELRAVTEDTERIRDITRAYHAMIHHVDTCVGRLVAKLKASGVWENTIIVFTSDHGEFLGNHRLLFKGPYLLDDLLRVPMIIAAPGRLSERQDCHELSSSIDLYSTLVSLAGGAENPERNGRPMLDVDLKAFPQGVREEALVEWEHWGDAGNRSLRCIRTARDKLVHYNFDSCGEYYDLANDADELVNRYDDPAHAGRCSELLARLQAHYMTRRPSVLYEGGW